jgi:hypothetical protein
MWPWFERRRQRARELRQGVDADLVRANRRRRQLTAALYACCFLLIGIQTKLKFVGFWRHLVVGATIASFLGGFVSGLWARQESAFLNRPDPEDPPKLWK